MPWRSAQSCAHLPGQSGWVWPLSLPQAEDTSLQTVRFVREVQVMFVVTLKELSWSHYSPTCCLRQTFIKVLLYLHIPNLMNRLI